MGNKVKIFFAVILLAVMGLSFYQLDYYVTKPGGTYNVGDIINIQNGDEDDEGTFHMTTVAMGRATPITYVLAKYRDYYDVVKISDVRQEEEDDEEYNIRQLKYMTDSQFNATYVAFNRAKLDYNVTYKGLYVLNVLADGAADGELKPGDEIVEADGKRIENLTMFKEIITPKKQDETIELVIKRDNELIDKLLTIKEIPGSDGRYGIGITYSESKSIKTDPKVTVNSEDIGGPSAGLMFTLEMLNQLLDEDLTKGYDIAGTGEMLEDGTVGRIGGIEKKIVTADSEGMEIFFAPDDEITKEMLEYNPNILSNYEVAKQTAEDIHSKMIIVPVKTIDDALSYLEKLQPEN
ncbi:peptidase [Lysinibacillus sp. 2017]|uniref:SepM family pheromone-processing serine protease n=1 Tax=unclassified Lysinibacillus TaxID=2636778 RepID=UPI000D52887B|nr:MULTISPECIES: SepM family pheromone-processing serine protease [unclassified Lysinibacillus]AWE06564.1 peptidase [Lysinibacillus sp. 2017]TGN35399.1 PDZ domain-containing protein [Lysinibacillus sp. S2017]